MERSQVSRALSALAVLLVLLAVSCDNPFAPALRGSGESIWTDASTVGGLLRNFTTSYELRDSLRYAELLDETFQFRYFDPDLHRSDGWYRETDLRVTAGLFRNFNNITVIFGGLAPEIEAISASDSVVDVRVQYQLVLDELSPLIGFATFTLYKPAGERFRIVLWQDEF